MLYTTVDRPDVKQYRELYAPKEAVDAVKAGKPLSYRAVVSNFDAAFRVVSAGLGVSVVPLEISRLHTAAGRIQTVALLDDWAHRTFSICFRRQQDLTPAAQRLLAYLVERAAGGSAPPTAA